MWLFVLAVVFVLIMIALYLLKNQENLSSESYDEASEVQASRDLSMYEKKRFLFDTTPEFNLFKILVEQFGKDYHVFPQINYSHLVSVNAPKARQRKYRSSIDRKSADFVLCDKATAVPVLVIELDGGAHRLANKQGRDSFIDDLMKHIGLPILHIKSGPLDKGFVRSEVNKKLVK